MKEKIRKKYMKDMLTIWVAIIAAWVMVGYVGFEIITRSGDFGFEWLCALIILLVLATSTIACISLMKHLTSGMNEIYEVDILNMNSSFVEGVTMDG